MIFNLFGKKEDNAPQGVFKDRVFIGTAGKMNACVALAKEQPATLFIAWFPQTAKQFRDFFKEQGLDEALITEARFVHTAKLKDHVPVFVEHYPLQAKETELVQNWDQNPILVFSSLDEPLFKHFGSEKMIPLIKMLGMKENEPIEHAMVSKSIIGGQHKIADKVLTEHTANSQAEWMERNMKD